MKRCIPRLVAIFVLLTSASVDAAEPTAWKRILKKDGVTVSTRRLPGQKLPVFRGRGVIEANLYDLLAVVEDTERHCEWRKRCHTSKILKEFNEFDRLIYSRIDMPWPVSDRDMVLVVRVHIDVPTRTVTSRFTSTHKRGPKVPSGVIRMARINGMFRFRELGPNRVDVTYQIDSDPGGWFPKWLVARTTRTLPVDTFNALRKRAAQMKGQYGAFHKRYNPAMGGKVPARLVPRPAVGRPAAATPTQVQR